MAFVNLTSLASQAMKIVKLVLPEVCFCLVIGSLLSISWCIQVNMPHWMMGESGVFNLLDFIVCCLLFSVVAAVEFFFVILCFIASIISRSNNDRKLEHPKMAPHHELYGSSILDIGSINKI